MEIDVCDKAKDYLIQVKVKNAPLMRAIRAAGYGTVGAFCTENGLSPSEVGAFVGLKRKPVLQDGSWATAVLKMSAALGMLPDQLFPAQHLNECLAVNTSEIEASLEEVRLMAAGAQPACELGVIEQRSIEKSLSLLLSCLTEREKFVVVERQDRTLREIGVDLGVNLETVRQIEAKAYRRMRGHAAKIGLDKSDFGLQ